MATTKVIIFVIIFHSIFVCALTKVPIFTSHSRGNLSLNIVVKYPDERLQVISFINLFHSSNATKILKKRY